MRARRTNCASGRASSEKLAISSFLRAGRHRESRCGAHFVSAMGADVSRATKSRSSTCGSINCVSWEITRSLCGRAAVREDQLQQRQQLREPDLQLPVDQSARSGQGARRRKHTRATSTHPGFLWCFTTWISSNTTPPGWNSRSPVRWGKPASKTRCTSLNRKRRRMAASSPRAATCMQPRCRFRATSQRKRNGGGVSGARRGPGSIGRQRGLRQARCAGRARTGKRQTGRTDGGSRDRAGRRSGAGRAISRRSGKRFPEDTVVQSNYLPMIHAAIALRNHDSGHAIDALAASAPYELGETNIPSPSRCIPFTCAVRRTWRPARALPQRPNSRKSSTMRAWWETSRLAHSRISDSAARTPSRVTQSRRARPTTISSRCGRTPTPMFRSSPKPRRNTRSCKRSCNKRGNVERMAAARG